MEKIELNLEHQPNFIFPNIHREIGEIQRVSKTFGKDDSFTARFIDSAQVTALTDLNSGIWESLENTDSFNIEKGDWNAVEHNASQVNRDWKDLKHKFEQGQSIDAPIIFKGEGYHLVSGNTRLMVSRAAGITPQVLVVEVI